MAAVEERADGDPGAEDGEEKHGAESGDDPAGIYDFVYVFWVVRRLGAMLWLGLGFAVLHGSPATCSASHAEIEQEAGNGESLWSSGCGCAG